MKKPKKELPTCDCDDCLEAETPCNNDCDPYEYEEDTECMGCRIDRETREEIRFEIDSAQGLYNRY